MRDQLPRQLARKLLHDCGVMAPEHIRVTAIARYLGIEIQCVPLQGANAILVRDARLSTILVSDRVTDPRQQRFDIAHELGHFLLGHGTCATVTKPSPADREYRAREAEANAFGAELLMPEHLPDKSLRTMCGVSPVNLEVPRRIADQYNVSILASAIRFTELASEPCAAVFSAAGKIAWYARSPGFRELQLKRVRDLKPSSMAHRHFATTALEDRPYRVPASTWVQTSADVEIVEHSIYARDLGTVLSMVWIPEAAAPQLGAAR